MLFCFPIIQRFTRLVCQVSQGTWLATLFIGKALLRWPFLLTKDRDLNFKISVPSSYTTSVLLWGLFSKANTAFPKLLDLVSLFVWMRILKITEKQRVALVLKLQIQRKFSKKKCFPTGLLSSYKDSFSKLLRWKYKRLFINVWITFI